MSPLRLARERAKKSYIDGHLSESDITIVALLVDLLDRRSSAILVVPRDLIRADTAVAGALRIGGHRTDVSDRQRLFARTQLKHKRNEKKKPPTF